MAIPLKMLAMITLSGACGGAHTHPAPAEQPQTEVKPVAAATNSGPSAKDLDQDRALDSLRMEVLRLQSEVEALHKKADARPAPRLPRPVRRRPDPLLTYSIGVAGSPWLGDRDALVTIVKGYEYACPFCNKVRPTLKTLLQEYKGNIRIVYRNYVVHPQSATEPALAACAAHQQGAFEAMDALLWDKAYVTRKFGRAFIETLAKESGLKMQRFRNDRDGMCKNVIKQDQAELQKVGVTGTPAFLINGRFLSGARPIQQFRDLIDEELKKAKQRLRDDSRLSRRRYYEREVIANGLKTFTP